MANIIIKSLIIIVTAVIFYALGFYYGRIDGYNTAFIENLFTRGDVKIYSSREEALEEQKKGVLEQIARLEQELEEIEELQKEQ